MKLYDITRELIKAEVYPGDGAPELIAVSRMADGACFNLTKLKASMHAATHCDAPLHVDDTGMDIASMPLTHYIGPCMVMDMPKNSRVDAAYFTERLVRPVERLLLKGGAYLSPGAAAELAARGIITIGTDALSIARHDEEAAVHSILLGKYIAIIEQLWLSEIPEGEYLLFAPPIKVAGAEGAPCRAVLIDDAVTA